MTAPEPTNRFARGPQPRAARLPAADGDPGPAPQCEAAATGAFVLAALAVLASLVLGWGAGHMPAPATPYGAPADSGSLDLALALLGALPGLGAAASLAIAGVLLQAVAHHLRQQARLVAAAQAAARDAR